MVERSGSLIASARRRLRVISRDEGLVAGVRHHDRHAFETVYQRHASQLLNFCVYLTGSRQDAEDALQATFISAYRALLADSRPVALRPWLFTIARNECLTIIRKRRAHSELNGEVALTGDPVRHAEVHGELVDMFQSIRELPERQRAALVLAEFNGMSHAEIGSVLGVRPHQVKAYVYQARTHLLSDRHARETDCREIREELANANGVARLRVRLRRHLRSCDGCRAYANGVETQRRQIAALMPLLPVLTLKYRGLEDALGFGGADPATYANTASAATTAVEVAGGGVTALVAKVATGLVAVGASAGVGVSVMSAPATQQGTPAALQTGAGSHALLASVRRSGSGGASSNGFGSGHVRFTRAGRGEVQGRWGARSLRSRAEAEGGVVQRPERPGRGESFVTEAGGAAGGGVSGGDTAGGGGGTTHPSALPEANTHSVPAPANTAPATHQHGASERHEARVRNHEERLTELAEHKQSHGGEGGHHEKTGTGKEGSGGSTGGQEGETEKEGGGPKKTHGIGKGKKHHHKEREEKPKREHHKHHREGTGGQETEPQAP